MRPQSRKSEHRMTGNHHRDGANNFLKEHVPHEKWLDLPVEPGVPQLEISGPL